VHAPSIASRARLGLLSSGHAGRPSWRVRNSGTPILSSKLDMPLDGPRRALGRPYMHPGLTGPACTVNAPTAVLCLILGTCTLSGRVPDACAPIGRPDASRHCDVGHVCPCRTRPGLSRYVRFDPACPGLSRSAPVCSIRPGLPRSAPVCPEARNVRFGSEGEKARKAGSAVKGLRFPKISGRRASFSVVVPRLTCPCGSRCTAPEDSRAHHCRHQPDG